MFSTILAFLSSKFSLKWIIISCILVIILGILVGGYVHYSRLVDELDELNAIQAHQVDDINNKKALIAAQQLSLEAWKGEVKAQEKATKDMASIAQKAVKQKDELNELFSKHNFEELALRKPGLIENIINRGTVDAYRMLECSSGSNSESCSVPN